MKKIICLLLFSISSSIGCIAQMSCNSEDLVVVVKTDNLDQVWHDNYDRYICSLIVNNPNPPCRNYLVLDLKRMSQDNIEINKWLQKNQMHVCFPESYGYIRKAHLINPSSVLITEIEKAINNKDFFGYSYDEIEVKINDITTDRYDDYIVLKKNFWGYVMIDFNGTYSKGNSNFSIPFIKSLAISHNLADLAAKKACFVKFVYFEINDKINTFIKLTLNGHDFYYDYSQDPTRGAYINFSNYFLIK